MDMSSFAPPCVATRDALIDLLSNVNDLVVLQLAVTADPTNKDSYTASIKTQSDRLNGLLQNFASTITGAATPAASS